MWIWCYETMKKPVAGGLCLSCLNAHGKYFSLKARIQKFLKLIEISWLQVMKRKLKNLLNCLTCFPPTCQWCVSTVVKVSVMKNISWCGCCSFLIFIAKKAGKDTELRFLSKQGILQGGRVEDHRLMFTRHLYHNYLFKQYSKYIKLITWCLSPFTP